MTDFMKADVFFFVATIATILLVILVIIALIYFIRILRNVDDISKTAQIETHKIAHDVDDLRDGIRGGVHQTKSFFDFLSSIIGIRKSKRKKHK